MPLTFNRPRMASLLRRGFYRGDIRLTECSRERWEIHPGESVVERPAIFQEDGLSRILAVEEHTTREIELKRIRGGPTEHAATMAYRLNDVELVDGRIYCQDWMRRLTNEPSRIMVESTIEQFKFATLACTHFGSVYFAHWMADDLTLQLAAESIGTPVTARRRLYSHESGYADLMDIRPNKVTRARFEQLIVLEDVGQNSYKRQRYQALRARLARLPGNGHDKIFIRRGRKFARVARELTNSDEIERFLASNGFRIVDPDELTSTEIAGAMLGSRLVVSVEGSHVAHALYSVGDTAAICLLQPPNRFNNHFKDFTDCLGLNYAFVVGVMDSAGFAVDVRELDWVIRRCLT